MTVTTRRFPSYRAALTIAYEEEISGQAYFANLAAFHLGRAREALLLMAEMERITVSILAPLVALHDLRIADKDALAAEGTAEAQAIRHVKWAEIVQQMRDEYPVYVEEFADLHHQAPENEKILLQFLVDHEVAIIDFARLELDGDDKSIAPLNRYIANAALFLNDAKGKDAR